MYKNTLDSFTKFWEAYTKKGFSKYDEKKAFSELCDAMRRESVKYEKTKENMRNYIAEKRKVNPNYARPKNKK